MSIAHARHVAVMLSMLAAAEVQGQPAGRDTSRYTELARRIVQTSAAVKPGEVVYIVGGIHTVPIMDALAAEVARVGAAPVMSLQTERMFTAFFRDTPEQYLRTYDSASTAVYGDQLKRADVMVMLPVLQNPDSLIASFAADTTRMAKVMRTFSVSQQRFDEMRNTAHTRYVNLAYPPTRIDIARSGMDSTGFDQMVWQAMTTDYERIASAGRSIKRLLDSGKMVHVTTANGTDVRINLAGRSAAIIGATLSEESRTSKLAAQRTVNLPGGQVLVAPLETSGSGKIVVARDNCFGSPLVNARFELRAGKITGFQADSGGTCVTNFLNATPGPDDVIGTLSIGLNTALKPVEAGLGYRPWTASGAVALWFGNNTDLGGKNNTPAGFPFWLSRATVEIDGKVVVRDGQLTSEVAKAP